MKELVQFLTQSLVDRPEAVTVTEVSGEGGVTLQIRVDPTDLGKVIGKQGRTARAIRTLAKAASIKAGQNYYIDILN